MPALRSQLDPRSHTSVEYADHHRGLADELRRRLQRAADGGGEKARQRHTERGKLLARDRIDVLLDPYSPFLEIAPLAAEDMYDGAAPAAGMVCGIGRVMGQEVVVVANDATVKGGTYFPMTVKKHLRAQEIARENRLTCVYLVDSGGAFLPLQDEVFPDREHFGRIFYNQGAAERGKHSAGRGGDGLVHGRRCLRAGHVRRVDHRPRPGHDLPRRPAAGEGRHRRGGRCRGAGRRRRAHVGIRRGRPLRRGRRPCAADRPRHRRPPQPPQERAVAMREPREPLYPAEELYGIVPPDTRRPFDIREVIARLVDGSEFDEFKARYGKTWSPASPTSTAARSASSPTTASCSPKARSRARTSSSCATSVASRWCSCRTSPASWWAASTRTPASPRTGRRWSPRWRVRRCPSSRS